MADHVAFSGELYLLSAVSIVPFILPTGLSGAYPLTLLPVVDKTQTSFQCQTSWLYRVCCILSAVSIMPFILPTRLSGTYRLNLSPVIDKT